MSTTPSTSPGPASASSPVHNTPTKRPTRPELRSFSHSHLNVLPLAQKLAESLETIKSKPSTRPKDGYYISAKELDNLVARSQQIVRLAGLSPASDKIDDVALQITTMSQELLERLDKVDRRLEELPSQSPRLYHATSLSLPPPQIDPVPPVMERHSTLHFSDGNIVLSVPGEDSKQMLFRVHKSILSSYSPVFASMFTLPGPEHVGCHEAYDGVPCVRMPDQAEDFASLLQVLYDASALPYKRLSPQTPLAIRGVLTLATKYQMDGLRARIIDQFEADWPTTLKQWDRLEVEIADIKTEHFTDDARVDGEFLDDRLPEPASAIRLAMDFNVPNVLPAAFYSLSRLSIMADWHEYRRDDLLEALQDDQRSARWDLLTATDFKNLLAFREEIDLYLHQAKPQIAPYKDCTHKEGCTVASDWAVDQCRLFLDPLERLDDFACSETWWASRAAPKPCEKCLKVIKAQLGKQRGLLWNALVEFVHGTILPVDML